MSKEEKMFRLRKAYEQDPLTSLEGLRETVAKSWIRSRNKNISTQYPITKGKYDGAFQGMRAVNRRPVLFEYIFSCAESAYRENGRRAPLVVLITDARGNVIRLYGKAEQIDALRQIGMTENAAVSEEAIGTNAVGTCLYTRKPVYIHREEHYKDVLCPYTSYAAPIYDEHNEIAAVFAMLSTEPEVDTTLLNLVAQTANSIGKECQIYHLNHDLHDLQTNMDRLINTFNFGVVLMDERARIVKANSIARYFLLMYEYELIGQPITSFISPQDIDFPVLENDIYDQTVCIHSGEVKTFLFQTSVYLTNTWDGQRNYILVFHKAIDKLHEAGGAAPTTAKWHFNDIVGTSHPLMEAINLAKIASKTSCTVLITGESGVGKELFAQSIHNASSCANGPFIAVNCGAIPKGLAESELFGYENGAFTGAKKTGMPGKFELANGGTIFLDEIGDMSLELQICLLRFLQEQEVTRIGGKTPIKVNVRVIAATNKNLEDAINNSAFRMDLYYRLNIFNIHVPPLRERAQDIGNLAHYLLQKHKAHSKQAFVGFTPEALNAMQNYSWPGNVRELENVVERAVIIGRSDRIRLDDLPDHIRACYRPEGIAAMERTAAEKLETAVPLSAEQTEREVILRALRDAQGNVTKAAVLMGISRRTLYRKMEKYQIMK